MDSNGNRKSQRCTSATHAFHPESRTLKRKLVPSITRVCERIFEEKASGGRWDRPQLQRLLEQLRVGDVVIVWKLDRLSRSLKDLLLTLEKIERANVGFRSLTESIDTTTPAGRMMMQIVGSLRNSNAPCSESEQKADWIRPARPDVIGGRRPKTDLTAATRNRQPRADRQEDGRGSRQALSCASLNGHPPAREAPDRVGMSTTD